MGGALWFCYHLPSYHLHKHCEIGLSYIKYNPSALGDRKRRTRQFCMHFIVYNTSLELSFFPLPRSPEMQTGQHVVLQVAAQTPVYTEEEIT